MGGQQQNDAEMQATATVTVVEEGKRTLYGDGTAFCGGCRVIVGRMLVLVLSCGNQLEVSP